MCQRLALLFISTLLPDVALASNPGINLTEIALLPHRNIVTKFYKSLEMVVPEAAVEAVIFGNEQYGYFTTKDFSLTSDSQETRMTIHLVPPGYRFPLSFWVRSRGKTVLVAKDQAFVSPISGLLQEFEAEVLEGEVERPNFFVVGGAFPALQPSQSLALPQDGDETSATTFVAIINRYAEVVWMNFPARGMQSESGYIIAKPSSNGSMALLVSDRSGGYFEILDSRGQIVKSISTGDQILSFSMHHDFILTEDTLVTFSDNIKYLRDPRRIWSTMEPYRGDRLLAIDLKEDRVRPLWDIFTWFHPLLENPREFAPNKVFKRLHVKPMKQDFGHVNSIDHHSEHGWLISPRDFNGFLLYDDGFQKLKWRVGSDEKATHRFESGEGIFQQHHVSFLEDGHVMAFDNGKSSSRVVEIKVESEDAKIVWAFNPNPPIHSRIHGSAYLVEGRSLIAFFPNTRARQMMNRHQTGMEHAPSVPAKTTDYIFEVEYPSGKVLAKIALRSLSPHGSYRAFPMMSLAKSQFIGAEHVAH